MKIDINPAFADRFNGQRASAHDIAELYRADGAEPDQGDLFAESAAGPLPIKTKLMLGGAAPAIPEIPFGDFEADEEHIGVASDARNGDAAGDAVAVADTPLPSPTEDDVLDDLALQGVLAPTFAQRALANFLADKRRAGETLARSGTSYSERVVLDQAGIPYEVFLADAGLRAMLARFGSLFPLAEHAFENARVEKAGRTLIAFGKRNLDEMERLDVRVMRMHAGRDLPSVQWWADHMGVPRSLVQSAGHMRGELNKRLKAGTLKLGGVFKDPCRPTKKRLRELRALMAPVLQRHRDTLTAVPAHPERADKIWLDRMLDEAGIMDARDRDIVATNITFRRELTGLIDLVGMAPVGTEAARGVEVTYGMLLDREGDAVAMAREAYRRENPEEEISGEKENRNVDNQRSFLSRFRKANGRELGDPVAADLADECYFARLRLGCSGAIPDGFGSGEDGGALVGLTKGDRQYCESIGVWRGRATAIARAGIFPPTFCGAFATAMDLRQMDADTLARATGMPRRLIYNWRNGRTLPTMTTEHFVAATENALGVPAGTFSGRLGELKVGDAPPGRVHMTLASGRRIRLSTWWRVLPKGAASWSDEQLLPVLEEEVARHSRRTTVASVRRSAAQRNIWGLPEEDPACRLWVEWDDLVRFKRGLTGDHRVQLADDNWTTPATLRANRYYASIFERWSRLPLEKGGLGLAPHQVSFRLLLNPAIGKRYIVWRLTRCAELEHQGKEIGIQVASTEVNIASFFSGLLDVEFGWIPQSSAELGVPEPILTRFRLPTINTTKTLVEVIDDDSCRLVEVMPTDLVALLGRSWLEASAEARKHARALKSNLKKKFKLLLDPKDLIMPIVRHAFPMAVMVRMVREALKRVRPLETSPVRHARDYQRIVAALLLLLLVFRSETLRGLTWRSDGTGELRLVAGRTEFVPGGDSLWIPEHYEVVVDAERFKNVRNLLLRGPSWNRKDYERELADWGGLNGVLNHFIEVCRPILLDGRKSDLLLPPPKPQKDSTKVKADEWSESDFNYLINSFTRMWCVYNRRFGTGMVGVQHFGPHPFRDIIATHILKHRKNSDRWELAALILGTGEDQVRQRYGWIDTSAELSKVDSIISEAFEMGMGDAPLW